MAAKVKRIKACTINSSAVGKIKTPIPKQQIGVSLKLAIASRSIKTCTSPRHLKYVLVDRFLSTGIYTDLDPH